MRFLLYSNPPRMRALRRILLSLATCALALNCASFGDREAAPPITDLDAAAANARIRGDLRSIQVYRSGLESIIKYMDRRADLFPRATYRTGKILSVDDRKIVREVYRTFFDYHLALESINEYHRRDFYRLGGTARAGSFLAAYSSYLTRYRYSLEFVKRLERDPGFAVFLNEPVPELGLPEGSLHGLRYHYLNLGRAAEFAAMNTLYTTHAFATSITGDSSATDYGDLVRLGLIDAKDPTVWTRNINSDTAYVWKAATWSGPSMTFQNALGIVQRATGAAWLPVQAGVAEWMGDTKVYRLGRPLIQPGQIDGMLAQLQPGDVMLQRREWYLSNIGLPGYWSHAALYIGTADERRAFFQTPEVQTWVRRQGVPSGDFEDLLLRRHRVAYQQSRVDFVESDPGSVPHPTRVLEAISEGVSFTSLEHSAAADSVATLRPRLDKVGVARAILHAFRYAGRPYDFNFDFQTDRELVCTELVYRAYEAANLRLPLVRIMGRSTLPANEIARQFDENFSTKKQRLDLIQFLDGNEQSDEALTRDLAEFRRSWQRPKWHILLADEAHYIRAPYGHFDPASNKKISRRPVFHAKSVTPTW
ncbi:MAG: YiiX/YebB-like N1pC/P60 family cysteine hydrolase [bacterium]|nr:YiiX/YebB-like N1pC/P60 family cysteine hydrolase [bacterium]